MKKRILSMVMALALCLTLLPATAWAEGTDTTADVWDGTSVNTDWYTNAGDGTTEFTISTAAELAGLASLVNSGTSFSGATITLGADIDLNGKAWTPIGKYTDNYNDPAFQGTFNGNGKTVSGLCVNINATGYTSGGLFGYVKSGTVQNVNVEGTVTVTSTSSIYVGGVVGYAGTGSTVENCSFSGDVTGSDRSTGVGGVVGYAYQATTIKNCFHSGTITTESQYGGSVGGVVGYAGGTTVNNCYNTGKVSNTSDAGTSGLSASIGGVVGSASGTTVNNCYNTGVVESTHNSPSKYSTSHNVGGVAGYAGHATVKNCYNTGTVTGTSTSTGTGTVSTSVGGVVGTNGDGTSPATVSNCYFLDGTASQGVSSGHGSSTVTNVEDKTAAAFASGEVAYLLSGGETQDETSPWRQNLGTNSDTAPTLDSTHAQVVQLGDAYANTSTGDDGTTCYLIYTAEQLKAFASAVNGGQTSINARLMNDIDLSSVCSETLGSWTPIGTSSKSFQGTFDGQGHTVSGLYVSISKTDDSVYAGLFGRVYGGTVKNLAVSGEVTAEVTDSLTSNSPYAGGVAGYNNGGNVENCSFSGNVSASVSSGQKLVTSYAGGVAGYNNGGNVENCYHTGTVTATATGSNPYNAHAGGVAGFNSGTVTNCYHTGTGTVTASGGQNNYAGGVVGSNAKSSTVTNCYFLQEDGSSLSGIGNNNGTAENVEGKDTAAFASGEVAYLLQGSQTGTVTVWVQVKGTNGAAYPTLLALLSDSDTYYTVRRAAFTAGENTTYQYTNSAGEVTVPNLPEAGGYVGWYIGDTQYSVGATIPVGNSDIAVVAKTQASTPGIAIDYINEALTGFADGAAYTIDGTAVTPDEDNTLSLAAYMGQTVSIVRKGGDGSVDSAAQTLTIPVRPAAPTGVQGENETVDGKNDGKITNLTANQSYELSADSGTSWEAKTADNSDEISGLAPGSYQIRLAATNTAFASAAADVTIATGAARTYTLNVTAPTFDAVVYGYDQPAAQPIAISNSGNSASTVSDVALSGDTDAFVLSKPEDGVTVQPGQSDTSYAIRPAAGLDAGVYTATITVAYQGGQTATATVSFTVTQAAQEAPAAPELDSRTTNSITLKTVDPNANGAAAEYGISTDGGETWAWQASPEFTGLASGTEYTYAVRYGATEDGNYVASLASNTSAFSTDKPSIVVPVIPTYPPAVENTDNGTVSVTPANPRQGSTVAVTPNPDRGYEVAGVTVTDSKGNPVAVTDNGDGTFRFTQPAGKVTISVTYVCDGLTDNCPSYHLADVDTTKWYHLAVDFVVENGLMNGYGNGSFGPNDTLTRAELAQILYNKEERPAVTGGSVFTDVADGAWYANAVIWANWNGIVGGYGNGRFGPGDPITREQLAVMLWRYAGCPAATQKELRFTDADQVSSWAWEAMLWATENGVVNGYNGILNPRGTATRAEAAQMLKNFIENI